MRYCKAPFLLSFTLLFWGPTQLEATLKGRCAQILLEIYPRALTHFPDSFELQAWREMPTEYATLTYLEAIFALKDLHQKLDRGPISISFDKQNPHYFRRQLLQKQLRRFHEFLNRTDYLSSADERARFDLSLVEMDRMIRYLMASGVSFEDRWHPAGINYLAFYPDPTTYTGRLAQEVMSRASLPLIYLPFRFVQGSDKAQYFPRLDAYNPFKNTSVDSQILPRAVGLGLESVINPQLSRAAVEHELAHVETDLAIVNREADPLQGGIYAVHGIKLPVYQYGYMSGFRLDELYVRLRELAMEATVFVEKLNVVRDHAAPNQLVTLNDLKLARKKIPEFADHLSDTFYAESVLGYMLSKNSSDLMTQALTQLLNFKTLYTKANGTIVWGSALASNHFRVDFPLFESRGLDDKANLQLFVFRVSTAIAISRMYSEIFGAMVYLLSPNAVKSEVNQGHLINIFSSLTDESLRQLRRGDLEEFARLIRRVQSL